MKLAGTREEEVGVAEASRRLKVTVDHVYALVWATKLRARKVDGRWLIPIAEIEERQARRAES